MLVSMGPLHELQHCSLPAVGKVFPWWIICPSLWPIWYVSSVGTPATCIDQIFVLPQNSQLKHFVTKLASFSYNMFLIDRSLVLTWAFCIKNLFRHVLKMGISHESYVWCVMWKSISRSCRNNLTINDFWQDWKSTFPENRNCWQSQVKTRLRSSVILHYNC
jgi:hypothetical protein